jgi:hypothetical protein
MKKILIFFSTLALAASANAALVAYYNLINLKPNQNRHRDRYRVSAILLKIGPPKSRPDPDSDSDTDFSNLKLYCRES